MNEDIKVNLIISAIICILVSIVLFFAYKGYYPFNTGAGKEFHYYIYDNYNISFNNYNMYYDNQKYWCRESSKEIRLKKYLPMWKYHNSKIDEIDKLLIKLKSNQYSQFELKKDLSNIQFSLDQANLFGINYYKERAQYLQKNLNSKYEYNKKINETIKELENQKENIKYMKDVEIKKMLNIYCVKVLSTY